MTQARRCSLLGGVTLVLSLCAAPLRADPQLASWFTTYSGKYARIYASDTAKTNGVSLTEWTNGTTSQSLPAYCGVQEIDSSANWVYIRSTGLGSFIMGPWYLDAAHTQNFPDWPVNEKALYRIPRNPSVPATKTATGGGPIGYFVDGAAMFNSWDAYYWNGSADVQSSGGGTGYWNRDAYVNEGVTFDANNAHQANGQYHYHANPPALRYLLGDHVTFNAVTKTYPEATNTTAKHSPLLAWVADGYPLYGPYGYSNPTNAGSGVRRMISGYVLRNGQSNTPNLTVTGRTNLPLWAVRLYGVSITNSGPNVSTSYPLGRYMEDNDYLGDLGYTQGANFDLDEYNGRYGVTPEFPNGTYAYFVSISADGTPTFPYNIGRGYYGSPTGGNVTSIAETVTTNYLGGPNLAPVLNAPAVSNTTVTLTWSATEGGTYMVLSTTNFTSWNTNSTPVAAVLNTASYTNVSADNRRFYRVARTALASYDPVTGSTSGSGQTITMSPASGTRGGASFTINATISSSATPPPPPHTGAPVATFSIGSINLTGASYTYNADDSGTVAASLMIPAGATPGPQTVTITFSPPPGQTQGPSYTQAAAFTIN